MKKTIFIKLFALCFILASCADEFVDTTSLVSIQGVENQIVDGPSANAALLGMYADFQSGSLYDGTTTYFGGLYADAMVHRGSFPTFAQVAGNDPDSENVTLGGMFNAYYNVIFAANNLIASVDASLDNITQAEVDNIRGQAFGMRALCYLDLVRFFGPVPLDLTNERTAPELDASSGLARSSVADVQSQIISDLTMSISLLGDGNRNTSRMSTAAALALRAKVYMEQENYPLAQDDLEELLTYGFDLESDVENLYGDADNGAALSGIETVFGIPFTATDGGSIAFFFQDQPDGGRDEIGIGPALQGAFESSDDRANQLISPSGIARISKYTQAGTGADDVHVIRYADVLLRLAEIYARQDDPRAVDLINRVRTRSNASPIADYNSSNVVPVTANERLLEFFAEGGDRYHALKRLGLMDAVVQSKGAVFVPERMNLFPIPQNEIDNNSALTNADQNPGY